jgi:hypothetical protein
MCVGQSRYRPDWGRLAKHSLAVRPAGASEGRSLISLWRQSCGVSWHIRKQAKLSITLVDCWRIVNAFG